LDPVTPRSNNGLIEFLMLALGDIWPHPYMRHEPPAPTVKGGNFADLIGSRPGQALPEKIHRSPLPVIQIRIDKPQINVRIDCSFLAQNLSFRSCSYIDTRFVFFLLSLTRHSFSETTTARLQLLTRRWTHEANCERAISLTWDTLRRILLSLATKKPTRHRHRRKRERLLVIADSRRPPEPRRRAADTAQHLSP
jgi:hypothetical protein